MNELLKADSLCKKYQETHALKDAFITLYEGEITALLGPNGAGKTTLLKILATILTKDSGTIEILGYDLDRHQEEIRHLFGYVGQDTERSAYARLTARENLQFFGALRGMNKQQINRQIERLSMDFDFQGNLDKQFMHLSGGQKQTAVIIRALLHDPPLVYLDEPTKGLDPIIARKIRLYLQHFVKKEGKSLLLTSHILTEVEQLADRVALIHKGSVAISGTSQTLKSAVGTENFVEIESHGLSSQVLERIMDLESVLFQKKRVPGWISFGIQDPMEGMEAIIKTLREHHIRTKCRHHTVSLEDAFVQHVGELSETFEI